MHVVHAAISFLTTRAIRLVLPPSSAPAPSVPSASSARESAGLVVPYLPMGRTLGATRGAHAERTGGGRTRLIEEGPSRCTAAAGGRAPAGPGPRLLEGASPERGVLLPGLAGEPGRPCKSARRRRGRRLGSQPPRQNGTGRRSAQVTGACSQHHDPVGRTLLLLLRPPALEKDWPLPPPEPLPPPPPPPPPPPLLGWGAAEGSYQLPL